MVAMARSMLSSALVVGLAVAQQPTTNFSASVLQQIKGEVSLTELNSWCTAQYTACGILCGTASQNSCTGATLTWTCTCSNGSSPGLQYFQPTIVSNICNRALGDCLALHANDISSQNNCKSQYICGQNNVTAYKSSGGSGGSGAAATTSGSGSGGSGSGSGGSSGGSMAGGMSATSSGNKPTSTSSKAGAAVLQIGEEYGSGLLGAVFLGLLGVIA